MVFFTSRSSHFPRAVGRISATFSLIKKFPLVPEQMPRLRPLSLFIFPSRSPPSRPYRAAAAAAAWQRPDGIFIIKKYYSWLEG